MSRVKTMLPYLLWLVGFIILSHYSYVYELWVKAQVNATFRMTPAALEELITPFVTGLYTALLFIRDWRYRPNWPLLLCICLPMLILSLYPTFSVNMAGVLVKVSIPTWLMDVYSSNAKVITFLCGLTLLFGLFGAKAGRKSRR